MTQGQVSVESIGQHERRVSLRLPADQVDTTVGGRLREIARTAKMKGFRPGKVPAKVIEQRYGEQVRAEVVDGLLRERLDTAVRENDLRLAGSPRVEPDPAAGEGDLAYVATFEVMPEFGEIDVSKLEVTRPVAEVGDDDIDRMIENLRLQRRTWQAVERGAKDGDAVEIETWSQAGEVRLPAEGVEKGRSVLGSGQMLEAIDAAIKGMAPGQEKDVEVEFPADWRVKPLAGQKATVHLKVARVSEPVMPEADEDFIRSFGVKSGELEEFRREIRSNLERELKGALMAKLRREVGEKMAAAYADVDMPPRLVENEARAMARQAHEQQARRTGRPAGELPANAHEGFMDAARKRALVGLLVTEVARRNDLKLDQARVAETLRLIASTYEEPEQVVEMYRNDRQLMAGLQNRVMEEQVIDWIAERASHTDQKLSFQDAIR
jgi:trigger factor